jgi:ribosomal protein S6
MTDKKNVMSDDMKLDKAEASDAMSVYEVGYLITSDVPEEKVPAEVDAIKALITDKKGEIITEGAAHLHTLAYTMVKKIGTVNKRFQNAYFGWVKFSISPENVGEVKNALDARSTILRHLIIKTLRENTYLGKTATTISAMKIEAGEGVKEAIATEDTLEGAPVEGVSKEGDVVVTTTKEA